MQLRYVYSELGQGLRRNLTMHLAVILTLVVSLTLGALLVTDPGLTAALAIGLAQYLLAATDASSSGSTTIAVGVVVAFGLLTLAGRAASSAVLRWTAIAKLAIVHSTLQAMTVHTAPAAICARVATNTTNAT